MHAAFTRLFTVRLRHGFYADGRMHGDLVARATSVTATELAALGLGMRTLSDGFTVYAETDGAVPPRQLRPLGAMPLQLTFVLEIANSHLLDMTALPAFRLGRQVLCFDNLRDDVSDSRAHLGDSTAASRIGAPVQLVTAPVVTYRFNTPVNAATLTIRNVFGAVVHTTSFALSDAATRTDTWRIALDDVDALPPGRYTIEDDVGGRMALRYAPELGAVSALAIVDIYTSTVDLTAGPERVPASYRFLTADGIVTAREYHVQFESRATTWRYNVVRKYAADDATLAELEIAGGVAFSRALETGRAVFASNVPVALSEQPPAPPLELRDSMRKLLDLPYPDAATPLKPDAAPGDFASELFIYV